ncbi:hypothetical protein R1flu_006909 [Riccia fluitans]|uniref:Uncharacterized protein n=1 Tax=Riccia fluitans TaxID=41844 RepID=A0ABD1YXM6_9MARC
MGSEDPVTDLKLEMIGKPEMVVPAGETPSGPLFLSNIDQVVVIPVESIYFYPPNPDKGIDNLVDTLRDALAKVLVPFHFMAGRLQMADYEPRLQIDLNRAGAQFAHYKSGVSIADLGDVTIPNPIFRELIPTQFDAKVVYECPLLAIQVTTFKCGGYTVGVMMSHTLFDGPGAIDFFMNYAALARGENILFEPNCDRTPLKARDPPRVEFEHPELFKLTDLVGVDNPFTTPGAAEAEFFALQNSVDHVTRVFEFTPEMIETLKKRALEGGILKRVSTFEAVAAHLWIARTKSVDLLPDNPSNLLFAVDIRKRMKPNLPKHFAGNGVFSSCARATPEEIFKMTYVEAVQEIQKAIERVTDEYVRSSIDWGQIHRGVPALFGGFFLSAWWKMPFYEIDYGWGKPIYAGPVVTPMTEFVLLLSNGKDDGGLNLVIALEHEQMEDFEQNIKVQ